jgi:hypothetical protein
MHGKSGIQWAVNNMRTMDRLDSRMNCGMSCLFTAALMWFAWMAAMPEAWAQSLQCGDRVGVTYAGDYANIRDSACGRVIGQIRAGNEGQIASSSCSQTCSIGGTSYTFWNVRPHGWIAQGTSTQRWLVPMPGSGYYPNVSAPGAYPVRVYDDIGSVGLRVRLGPGLNYPEMDVPRRYPGETGTAYVVRVRQDEGLVWWRIRWSNGDIGWSADSQVPYGVYLVKTGGYSSFTIVQLRLEASGAGGSVGILVGTPDLDAAIPPNFTVSTPATLRYVSGDRVRLTAPQTAPNGAPFQRWLRNGSFYSNQRYIEFNITSNDTFTAVYAYPTNTISIQSSNPNSGVYITVSPNDNNGAGSGYTPFTRTYNQGTTVTLTAPATAGGNQFQEWQRNGVRVSTSTTYQFQVNANDTLTAVYRTPTNTISIQSSNPNSGVYITVSPNDNNGAGSGYTPFTRTYNQGTTVTLTAPATAGGNQFQEWQRNGVRVSTSTTYQFQVNANDTFTAVYRQHSIGIEVQPAAINFGDVWTIAAVQQQLRITNPSSSTGNLTGTLRTLSPPFAIEGERTFSLAPGQSHTVFIRYAPGEPRTHSAILYIDHNATTSSSPISVPIQGRGCDSDLLVTNTLGQSISGTTLRLTAEVGRTTNYLIRVTHRVFNNSQCPIIVTPVLSGSGSSAFSVSPSQTFVLEPNAERQVTLTFAPQRAGTHNAILEFRYTVSGMPANVYLFKRITLEGTARGRDNPGQQEELQFLSSLVAPWRQGQYWTPSTYDGHGGGNMLNAVDFNRAASSRSSCPYTGSWLQDCNEVLLASHDGRAYTRAQSGCTGYGNYIVLVSPTRVSGSSNTYLATIYAHLNYFLVNNGTDVVAGQPIARLGSTGSSTGSHLHYEIREVTVSGSTLTLGTRRQVLNNPAVRLSGQELRVDLNCSVSGLGYVGPPILGTASVGSIPPDITPSCTPYNCGNFLWSPESPAGRCAGDLPDVIELNLADVDGSGCVDERDLLEVLLAIGGVWGAADVNWDGRVDDADILLVLENFGFGCE